MSKYNLRDLSLENAVQFKKKKYSLKCLSFKNWNKNMILHRGTKYTGRDSFHLTENAYMIPLNNYNTKWVL